MENTLKEKQAHGIRHKLISFQSGNIMKDSLIISISDILSDRKTVTPQRLSEIEDIIEDVGFDPVHVKPMAAMIKAYHDTRSRSRK